MKKKLPCIEMNAWVRVYYYYLLIYVETLKHIPQSVSQSDILSAPLFSNSLQMGIIWEVFMLSASPDANLFIYKDWDLKGSEAAPCATKTFLVGDRVLQWFVATALSSCRVAKIKTDTQTLTVCLAYL